MGRGLGDGTAGTGSPLFISKEKRRLEEQDLGIYKNVSHLLEEGERVFLDSRYPGADEDFWCTVAAVQTLPYKDIDLVDDSSLEGMRDLVSQPVLLLVRPGQMFDDDNFQSVAKSLVSGKTSFQDLNGTKYSPHPEAIVTIADERGRFSEAPDWFEKKEGFLPPDNDQFVFDLTTEELGLISTGQTLTLSRGTKVFRITAKDLDCSTRQLAEGRDARVGNVVLRYS